MTSRFCSVAFAAVVAGVLGLAVAQDDPPAKQSPTPILPEKAIHQVIADANKRLQEALVDAEKSTPHQRP